MPVQAPEARAADDGPARPGYGRLSVDESRADRTLRLAAAAWALTLAVLFLLRRGEDVGRLPSSLRAFAIDVARHPVIAWGAVADDLLAILIAVVVVAGWYAVGRVVTCGLSAVAGDTDPSASRSPALRFARTAAFGAGTMSLVWFALGLVHGYRRDVAAAMLAMTLAVLLAARPRLDVRRALAGVRDVAADPAMVLVAAPVALAAVAMLAPPTGKDALIYHRAVPTVFADAGGLVDIPSHIAAYFAYGVEMNGVWALLLGRVIDARVGEAAFGAVLFAFFPLLLAALHGWARESGLSGRWAIAATAMVAAIPTAYFDAGSAYADLALALYATLAIEAAGRWWTAPTRRALGDLAAALACALAVKHVGILYFVPLPLLVLLVAHRHASADHRRAWAIVRDASIATGVAAAVGGVWYARTWVRTGNPLFPFYVDALGGHASGWDARRSALLSSLLSVYGGESKTLLDYVGAPVWISLFAQPEDAARHEGVLGIAFLFALPFLAWALWRRALAPRIAVAAAGGGLLFAFWLSSSPNLRYLLPALPALGLALVGALAATPGRPRTTSALRRTLLATTLVGELVTLAWFVDVAPLRAALGGESRARYLETRLDYFPYYELINDTLPSTARVWLIDTRRDTYYLERPYVADYLFEDWTIRDWVNDATSVADVRRRARETGITHVLVRHDMLFDPARSPIVDDTRDAATNEKKMAILRGFFLEGTRVLKGDPKFLLVELPPSG